MKIAFIVKAFIPNKEWVISTIIDKFQDFNTSIFETSYAGHAIELAKEHAISHQVIIAVGGDGTLNEVVNGLILSKNPNIIIGLLPFGTANDFAKALQIRNDISALRYKLEHAKSQFVDVGKVTFQNLDGKEDERFFINISDIGIGGEVVKKVNQSKKIFGSKITFFKNITSSFLTYKKQKAHISSDQLNYEGKVMSLVVANGNFFGSGLCIAPNAALHDGFLEVVLLGNVSIMDYILNIGKVKKGKLLSHPEVHYRKVKKLQVKSLEKPIPLDVDGEFLGYTPVKFEIYLNKIKFLA